MTFPSPGFTGSRLDRSEALRTDPGAPARLARDPAARLLALDGYTPRVEPDGRLGWVPLPAHPVEELALLGMLDGAPRFAWIDPHAAGARRSAELMALLDTLSEGEAGTYATARSLLDWHARHRFCANCGSPSVPMRGGWARLCRHCGTEHYPRTDPVCIMLAEHGEGASRRILVGRQPAFPPGRYSALAGFVEVGESLEEAVARELAEEAGVVAGAVRYVSSQPWPFPSQLMLACFATVDSDTLRVDQAELEDAKWVTKDEVAAALAGDPAAPFIPPPAYAIAHTLFRAWLDEQDQPTNARSIT